jgi:tRNA-intron endonuclease
MDGRLRDDGVHVGAGGRRQFYDSRGYGRPRDDGDGESGLCLSRVEAAHLLYRDDLAAVRAGDRRLSFRDFLAEHVDIVEFLVYKDLRDRGFYLSVGDAELTVYPRGKGPWDDEVAHRVRPVGERDAVAADELGEVVLGVVDEESEITYLETETIALAGGTEFDPPAVAGDLLGDRVVVWEPPERLHQRGFYGQPFDEALQLSLLEAAYLAAEGALAVEGDVPALVERGRTVEGERFDRRLRTYRAMRDAGLVPKTGFKFGADFRVYGTVDSVEELGHAEHLVRVLEPGAALRPRELSLDVRLAHGVRKQMVFARAAGDDVEWLAVGRLTP